MSVKVMSWVWEHSRSKGNDRLVLLAIADYAQDDGRNAYPSIANLAEKTVLSRRTVQRAVEALVTLGELSVMRNAGRAGANMYRVLMGKGCHSDTSANLTPASEGHQCQNDTASDCHAGGVNLSNKGRQGDTQTVSEPSKNRQSAREPKAPTSTTDPRFVEFWNAYPRHVAKPEALRRFAAAITKGAQPEDIIAGAKRYAAKCRRDGTDERFIAHPATWLNQGRWTDGPSASPTTPSKPAWEA